MEILLNTITPIVIGVLLIVFRNYLASDTMKSQNKTWGFHFGEKDVKASKFVIVVVGLGFIIGGLVFLLT